MWPLSTSNFLDFLCNYLKDLRPLRLATAFSSAFSFIYSQSLIRTAEQLKIKGLCEINDIDHTNAAESDETEVIYPPHKKIRASRNYENNNSLSNSSNKNLSAREEFPPSSTKSATNSTDKDAQQSVASHEEVKHKSKATSKEQKNASSSSTSQQAKNMASLEMGMVS